MENLGYLAAAYTIIFAAIFMYLVFLWRRQARLNQAMRALENRLEELRNELVHSTPPASRSASH